MGNRKSGDVNSTAPGIGEPFDAVGCEDQVEIEWSIFQLNEIFPAQHVAFLVIVQSESEVSQGGNERCGIVRILFDKQIGILRGIGKTEKDRAGLADEEVPHSVALETATNLL